MAGQRASGSHGLTAKLSLPCLPYCVFDIDTAGKPGCHRKRVGTVAMN
jgi:hypothetical protein